jgi:predicted  nucleic acid-binding Zn-ribbon protein
MEETRREQAQLQDRAQSLRNEVRGLEQRRQDLGGQIADAQSRLEQQRRELSELGAQLTRERSAQPQRVVPTSAFGAEDRKPEESSARP